MLATTTAAGTAAAAAAAALLLASSFASAAPSVTANVTKRDYSVNVGWPYGQQKIRGVNIVSLREVPATHAQSAQSLIIRITFSISRADGSSSNPGSLPTYSTPSTAASLINGRSRRTRIAEPPLQRFKTTGIRLLQRTTLGRLLRPG